jgi:glucose/arabinose dehydrogenase
MSTNGQRLEPDLSHFHENWNRFPPEEEAKYWGKHVAVSPDGKRIVESADTWEELNAKLEGAAIDLGQVVHCYIDPPDVSYI